MIDGLKPYPGYKASGTPWLDHLPESWEVLPVKRRFGIQLGMMLQNTASGPSDSLCQYLKALHVQWFSVLTKDLPQMWASPDEVEQYGVQAGDLLVCEGGEGGRSGMVRALDCPAIIQNALHRVRPFGGCRNEYLQYVMSTISSSGWFDALNNKATIAHFTREKFGALRIPLPPPDEQSTIVRFLDHADRKIRRYIRAKQRLIKLLEEQKQAIIDRTITQGLDPSKPSKRIATTHGHIPWLVRVPERWMVLSSKRIFASRKESARPNDVQLSATQAYGVIPQGEFERRVGRRVVKISLHLEKRRHAEKDDFVISMRSFEGGIERTHATGCIRSSYVVLRPRPSALVGIGYFSYLFKSQSYIQALRGTANFIRDGQDLSYNNFCLIDLPAPPIEEQKSIADFLDHATSEISAATSRARKEAELLRELRIRLIADVVTGKLDVREAAAKLPDGDPEPAEEMDQESPISENGDMCEEAVAEPEEIEA